MAEKNAKYFKTKDGTIVLCKDEFARQQIEQLQGIWEAIEELPDGQAVSAQVAIHTTEIAALQSGKANINGSYDSMTVGMAKNVEATSEISGTSLYRPTAGNADVADGVARTLKIGGNATQWNQILPVNWVQSGSVGNVTYTINSDGSITLNGEVGESNRNFGANIPLIVNGHTYYYSAGSNNADIRVSNALQDSEWGNAFIINNISNKAFYIVLKAGASFSNYKIYPQIHDLTLMFGSGNEPATPEAFEAWLQSSVGLQTYYPYNPGKLLAAKLLGLRTVWLNQWDEEWELGKIGAADGQNYPASNQIRSKNYISVFSATEYYFKGGAAGIKARFYRSDKSYIGYVDFNGSGVNNDSVFKTPADCSYMRFALQSTYGTTYNHDICINLHYTNGKDGQYEPYVEHQYDFDVTKIYGKLGGEGELVQIFPNGLKSAGSARDELTIIVGAAKATKRVGSVDLGSLEYTWRGDGTISSQDIVDYKLVLNVPALCSRLQYRGTVYGIAQMSEGDKQIALFYNADGTTHYLYIKDTSLSSSDVSQQGVVSKLSGVLLFYELAEPAEYTDLVYRDNGVDKPIDALNIQVSNYGTEEQIVESPTNGDPNSCAATLDILYGVNAADFMDAANNGAFVSKASLDALCNTLGSALGGTLTSTWNSAEGHYDFTFTPATRQIENPENNE